MSQTFNNVPSSETLTNSRQDLLDRDLANQSNFSGTSFFSSPVEGMHCYRTDLFQLYRYRNGAWVLQPDFTDLQTFNWVGSVGGTVDAITATFSPAIALTNGTLVSIRAGGANTSTTPTFNANSLGAKTIFKAAGAALVAGDIMGSGHELLLRYNTSLSGGSGGWTLLNPRTHLLSGSSVVFQSDNSVEVQLQRNAQTGTSYTLVSADRKHVTLNNSSAIAVTLPQAGGTGFTNSWFTIIENIGAGVVTITPTTSTINGAATLVLRKGQWAVVTSDGTNYRALMGGSAPGRQSVWVPARGMVPRITNGPAGPNKVESGTNKITQLSLDFNDTMNQFAQFDWLMPKAWDLGTVSFQAVWQGAAAGNVIWGLQGVAISDNDATDAAFGTAQEVTDTRVASDDLITAESSAITIAGSPAAGDRIVYQVYRNAASGSDTMTGNALLLGLILFFNTSGANDQ